MLFWFVGDLGFFGPDKKLEINYYISLDGFLIEFSLILYNLFCDYDD